MKKTFLSKNLIIILMLLFGYSALSAAELYKSDAIVSYYGEKFHGKPTSSGEKYNMNDFTCANKTLPFGTILKVTNLSNNKSVQVRVNDRGPFVIDRELDLSKAAAARIDMIASGTAHVKIEIIKKVEHSAISLQTAESAKKLMAKKAGAKQDEVPGNKVVSDKSLKPTSDFENAMFDIQLASFKDKNNANHYANLVLKKGITNVVLRHKDDVYRVVVKNISKKELAMTESKLIEAGYSDFIVKRIK